MAKSLSMDIRERLLRSLGECSHVVNLKSYLRLYVTSKPADSTASPKLLATLAICSHNKNATPSSMLPNMLQNYLSGALET